MKPSGQRRVFQATAVGALLFVVYVLLNVTRMPPADLVPEPWKHMVALIGGLALIAWASTARTGVAAAPSSPPRKQSLKEMARVLGVTIDGSDPFSRGRSYRFGRFCLRVGERLGLSGTELDDLENAAMLHDLGRASIESEILYKPGVLNATERDVVRSHPTIAYEILKAIPEMERVAEIVYAHHEQPDGRGYPRGLKAEEIPLASSIVMVVAAFDAMTSERPYRSGLSPSEAYGELKKAKGTMFEPRVVDTFIELHGSGSIFEGWDESEITRYTRGDYASRALEDYLKEHKKDGEDRREHPAA